jgi:murein DD-endopeptidase MepM/ murein hydrolase activator NlpD
MYVARSGTGAKLRPTGIGWIALAVFFACFVAPAAAETGGAPTPAGMAPAPPTATGTPAAEAPSAGTLSLVSAQVTPRKSFYYGVRYPSLHYSIGSDQPLNDLRIDVVDAAGEVMASYYRNDIAPGVEDKVRWSGTTALGRPAPNGRYSFRIVPQAGTATPLRAPRRAHSSEAPPISLGFSLYGYAFPLLGAHDFGGAAGRFGAARSGHTHEGQDVMASCGVPIVAARGGRVQYAGYQGAAGNYIVIDGRGTSYDMAYMHMSEPSLLQEGMTVRTGQPIGIVGETGDAVGCHLHFEMWGAPGWYEGGSPIDPLPYLERWDRYS